MYEHALVFGRASGVWEEIKAAKKLFQFDLIVAVGSVGIYYPESIHCWVSYHANRFPEWISLRTRAGHPPADSFWTSRSGLRYKPVIKMQHVECYGADSGLIGVVVALQQAKHVVLAGIPLEPERGQFDTPARWDEALNHRKHWQKRLPELQDKVFSMSGWTQQLLGAPCM